MKNFLNNETWIIESGDRVIQKKAKKGIGSLTLLEKLVYCFWVADYGMRNAGDLDTAYDLYADFHSEASQASKELNLQSTYEVFSMSKPNLERAYFDRFDSICNEIRNIEE
jgi:hypothetical protein